MDGMKTQYQPPYTITPVIVNLVARISEAVGRLTAFTETAKTLRLRRINRVRTIRGSLAIKGNTLTEEQITAILGRQTGYRPASGNPGSAQCHCRL
jgi:Fic family protein